MDSPQTLFVEKWIKQFPNTILDSDFVNMIYEIINYAEKQAYNQAIKDSQLKIEYDVYSVEIATPTNNAGYYSKSEEFIDFISNYEDSIKQLKIK